MRGLKLHAWGLLLSLTLFLGLTLPAAASAAEPAYAKWGQLAVRETQQKYPKAALVDYLHIGRQEVKAGLCEEKFKLWLREGNREFGVYVTIRFDKQDEHLVSIRTDETKR